MNNIVSFDQFTKGEFKNEDFIKGSSVVVDERGVPEGFIFKFDAFESMIQMIDKEFERKVVK